VGRLQDRRVGGPRFWPGRGRNTGVKPSPAAPAEVHNVTVPFVVRQRYIHQKPLKNLLCSHLDVPTAERSDRCRIERRRNTDRRQYRQ